MKSLRPLAFLALLPFALCACNTGGVGNFAGSYGGTWSMSVTTQGNTTDTSEGRVVAITASTAGDADLLINLQTTTMTECVLKATRNGDDATITAGQTCNLRSGSMTSFTFTVQTGTASLYPSDGGVAVDDAGHPHSTEELIINLTGTTPTSSLTAVYDGTTR